MNPFVGLAISIVPDLMKMFSGEKAGGLPEAVAKNLGDEVTRVVAATTQASTVDDAAKRLQSDPAVKAELQIKLAQIALEAQRAAFEHAERQRQAELAEFDKRREAAFRADQMAMESTESARKSARDFADKSPLLAWTPATLSYIVVVGFLALLLLMSLGLMKLNESDGSILQIFNILIGAMAAAFATVINFWLGSSLGSRRKDDVIETQAMETQKQDRSRPPPAPTDGGTPATGGAVAAPGGGQMADRPGGQVAGTPGQPSGGTPAAPVAEQDDTGERSSEPATPARIGLIAEVLPELIQPHRHFADGVSWALTSRGISIDEAPAKGTLGEPKTVREIWEKFGKLCAASARKFGVPVELIVATIATESSGNPNARRAEPKIGDESVGLMQTLVKTAREATGRRNLTGDDLLDPATSIDAGTAYIAKQRGVTHFDPPLVAAAYNAGSLKRDGGSNRWRLRCFPLGTGHHIDRFAAWFCDAMRVAAEENWGADNTPSFAAEVRAAVPITKTDEDFPAPPSFRPLLTTADRQKLFGAFDFRPDPRPDNKEHIRILGDWAEKNIVRVEIPVQSVLGKPGPLVMQFHRLGAEQLKALWLAWEKEGLLDRVLSFDGAFVPRFTRGSTSSLSNHAFGTAFDINAAQNPLKAVPVLVGQRGCVRELVEIANQHGFFWGGHFNSRLDGMHFEIAQLK